ncbi:Mitochondrial Carrier (MC) Family, partial [Phytophthora palmivora]
MEKMDTSHKLSPLRPHKTRDLLMATPKVARVHQQSIFQSMWIGATAGMGGIIAVYPVDVVKTRMQNSRVTSSAVQTLTTIFRNEGVGSFYKGLGPQPAKAKRYVTRQPILATIEVRTMVESTDINRVQT